MSTHQTEKQVLLKEMISTIIELLIGGVACFLSLKATIIGFLIGTSLWILLSLIAYQFPNHFFLYRAKQGSSAEAFWQGQLWKSYRKSLEKRGSLIATIISDNWVLIALLCYAFSTEEPIISCGLLGAAAAFSSVVLIQYLQKERPFLSKNRS